MALIKFGTPIAQLSGKKGGNIYHRDRFGTHAIAKIKYNRKMPSATQANRRRAFGKLASWYWNTVLDHTDRAMWAIYGRNHSSHNKLGERTTMTGHQAFLFYNLNREVQFFEVRINPRDIMIPIP